MNVGFAMWYEASNANLQKSSIGVSFATSGAKPSVLT
jgi:hypothetical protein